IGAWKSYQLRVCWQLWNHPRANQFGVCVIWKPTLFSNQKKSNQDGGISGVCYWEIFYVNKGVYTTFYMSTSTRFVVNMLHECCQGRQNIVTEALDHYC